MSKDNVLPPEQRNRVILSMYKTTIQEKTEYVKFIIDDDDINKWYVMIEDLSGENDEFKHCQYLVRIELPPSFPYDPPHFYFLTPNGVYGINAKVCVMIGEFHSNNYPSAQKVRGFVINLVSGIIGWRDLGSGINILNTSESEKRALARKSMEYNRTHYPDLVDRINANYAEYSALWKPDTSTTTTTTTTTTAPASDAAATQATTAADAPAATRTGRAPRPQRRKLGEQ